MHAEPRRFRPVVVLCLAVLAALCTVASAGAYIVVLKDGTQINTAKKYEVEGDRVILTMPNGTKASYRAAEVDFDATDEMNKSGNLNQARVIERREVLVNQEEPEEEESLSDLVAGRGGLSLPPPRSRDGAGAEGEGPALPTTRAGFVDLMALERTKLDNDEVEAALISYFDGQGQSARIYAGSAPSQPLVEMRANAESAVFKALRDAASALVQVNGSFPSQVKGLDLLILTDSDIRAGQFSLTPEQANLLVTGKMQPAQFFVRYVEY